ncbi:MAG: zinc ribbon domain-containing protein [Candidatus Magasanikiibacteriota bacterium]
MIEEIKCDSCGLPLDKDNKPQKNNTKWNLCRYCVCDETGEIWPKEDIISGSRDFYFVGELGLSEEEAQIAAENYIKKMPAWLE